MTTTPMELGSVSKSEAAEVSSVEFGGGAIWQIAQVGVEKEEEDEKGEQNGQRSLECLSEPLGISLGRFLEASWDVWGVSWRSWGILGRLDCLGWASWGRLGPSWGPLGGLLEASWEPLGGLLGASWGHLGGLLGHPGRLLGPSWRTSSKEGGVVN